ncbi:MAG: GNAT family N-acetyltransferase, partial [Chitinophagales bacterium]
MLLLNFKPFPVLTTERLYLRRMTEEDVEEIFFLRSDKQMLQYLDRDPARSIDEALSWIKMINEAIDNDQYIAWGIALRNEPVLIGTITFWNVKKDHYRAEIGYLLNTHYQGKGLMQEAVTAVLEYGFKIMKLHSVEANVNPANKASIKLLERNNFVQEAYHKENYYYNGKFFDSVIYSLLT